MEIPLPTGSFMDWAEQLISLNPTLDLPNPSEDERWQDWAENLIDEVEESVPLPYDFVTWQEWAEALKSVLITS